MVSVIEELRQNDPERTEIWIRLRDETSDADLAQALEQNPFVTEVELSLAGEQPADWTYLLRVIATRSKLENVTLKDAHDPEERIAPAALVRAFLQAIQQNHNRVIRRVDLRFLRLPTDISTFLDNASSIASFGLYYCDMDPAEREQGASSLAAALQRSTNIERLSVQKLNDIYTIPILEGLRSNVSLQTFLFSPESFYGCGVPCVARALGIHDLHSEI